MAIGYETILVLIVVDPIKEVNTCKDRFKETSERISSRLKSIKDNVEAKKLAEQRGESELMRYLSIQDNTNRSSRSDSGSRTGSLEEDVKLPCYYAPFPANPNFFGRKGILGQLEDILTPLQPNYDGPIKSVAIWATAGIGKTQIALEFGNQQKDKGVPAVLWINSEDESSTAKAFTEIASMLELPGASDARGHDQNRLLVLKWLQTTSEWRFTCLVHIV